MRILILWLESVLELVRTLDVALREDEGLRLLRERLPVGNSASYTALLAPVFSRAQPDLVLLCLPPDALPLAEAASSALHKHRWEAPLVLVLDSGEQQQVRSLLNLGAADFILGPLRSADILPRLHRWHRSSGQGYEVSNLKEKLGLRQFVGESPLLVEAMKKIPKIARFDVSVLLSGETGTGKEMFARAIHYLSPRASRPFVPLNCGAIPPELVENELFGHESGAFTGANSSAHGLVHEAAEGTLFLDEVDSLPLPTQVKFLRLLQTHEYRPLGARQLCRADIRVIAASNTDLESVVGAGRFRSDLFYRLNVLPLKLPALRERREDIPALVHHFAAKYAGQFGTSAKQISAAALQKLMSHEWPGNVRELENIIEHAVVLSEQPQITCEDICLPGPLVLAADLSFRSLKGKAIAEFETAYIQQLLAANEGNISKAARAAKKDRRAFWELMRKHHIPSSNQMGCR